MAPPDTDPVRDKKDSANRVCAYPARRTRNPSDYSTCRGLLS